MRRFFESIAFEDPGRDKAPTSATSEISYEFLDGDDLHPYLRIRFLIPVSGSAGTEVELDIPQDDMIDLINEVIDEWPEIVDRPHVQVKRGVKVLPVFS